MEPINPSLAGKQRLRWTHELHERFVDAVAQLGGPDRKFSEFSCNCAPIFPLNPPLHSRKEKKIYKRKESLLTC